MKTLFKGTLFILMSLLLVGCTNYDPNTLVITLNEGVDTIQLHETFLDKGAQASIEDGIKRPVRVTFNNVDTSAIGTYYIVYETQYLQVKKTITRVVVVIDQAPPYITINPGIDTIYIGDTWIDEGVRLEDPRKELVGLTVSGSVNSMMAGEYILMYQAVDSEGNTATTYRYVYVLERMEAPWVKP
jgi:hypothetical protein